MDSKQVQTTYQTVLRLLLPGRLKEAFAHLLTLDRELGDWHLHEQLESLQQNYRYMLQYYIDGMDDPERLTIYNRLIARLFLLTEEIRENLGMQQSTGLEYTQKRYFPNTRRHADPAHLLQALLDLHARQELLATDDAAHGRELTRTETEHESLLPEVFGLFWLTTRLSPEEKELFRRLTATDYAGSVLEQALAVSALTLNLWRMFDEEKLMLLFDCCDSDNQALKQRALVGLCFILTKYDRFLDYFPAVRNRLVLLADDEHNLEHFRNIITQIIATTETEKISKRLREDILPELAKLGDKLRKKTDMENLIASDDWEEINPQWQETLEDSAVTDKLKELTELQIEGADVYMATFSALKTFPFFRELSNWFLPFSPRHSSVSELFADSDKGILNSFANSRVMCDSDLYSFCLSVLQMPASQRDIIRRSFKAESEQIDEMKREESMLTPQVNTKDLSKQYIQDLFRFFKLHPQRADFADMFDSSLRLHRTRLFDTLATDSEFKETIAGYYFSKQLYTQAIELYRSLIDTHEPSADRYQKIGYAYQKTSQLASALDAYLKADIICPDDLWTVKKTALCYRLLGEYEKALEYYRHAHFLNPEDLSTQMHIARCCLLTGKVKEAMSLYFKLDAEHEDDIRIQRALSWTAFIAGNLSQADYYMQKVLAGTELTAQDFLHAGHIAWCSQKRKAAAEYYRRSLTAMQNNPEAFQEAFHEDLDHLKSYGVNADELPLMIDEVQYQG